MIKPGTVRVLTSEEFASLQAEVEAIKKDPSLLKNYKSNDE